MDILQHQLAPAAIEAVASRIAAHVRRTPLLHVDGADFALPGVQLVFKLEFTQHAGSRRLAAGTWPDHRGAAVRRQHQRGGAGLI